MERPFCGASLPARGGEAAGELQGGEEAFGQCPGPSWWDFSPRPSPGRLHGPTPRTVFFPSALVLPTVVPVEKFPEEVSVII